MCHHILIFCRQVHDDAVSKSMQIRQKGQNELHEMQYKGITAININVIHLISDSSFAVKLSNSSTDNG